MLNDTEVRTLPIDAHVIALNSTTDWNIKRGHKQYIKAIRTVYFYDKNEVTYCCEMTPSYTLYFLYNEVVLNNKGLSLADDDQDDIYGTYEDETDGDLIKYYHCRGIDKLEGVKGTHYHYGDTGVSYDDTPYDEQIEGLNEHFRCNHKL